MIKDEHIPAMQGMFPSWITSCSKEGEPNTTVISQIWYVDENHVALSFQFFIDETGSTSGRALTHNKFANLSLRYEYCTTNSTRIAKTVMNYQRTPYF